MLSAADLTSDPLDYENEAMQKLLTADGGAGKDPLSFRPAKQLTSALFKGNFVESPDAQSGKGGTFFPADSWAEGLDAKVQKFFRQPSPSSLTHAASHEVGVESNDGDC